MTTTRAAVHTVLNEALEIRELQYKEVAKGAGITTRHLYRARKGEAPDAAIHVLRCLGYTVTEVLEIREPTAEEPTAEPKP